MREKNVRFELKDLSLSIKTSTASSVMLKYACHDGRLSYPTGEKILATQFIKGEKYFHRSLQTKVNKLRAFALEYIDQQEKADKSLKRLEMYNYIASKDNPELVKVLTPSKAKKQLRVIRESEFNMYDELDAAITDTYKNGRKAKSNEPFSVRTYQNWLLTVQTIQLCFPDITYDQIMEAEKVQGKRHMNPYFDQFTKWCEKKDYSKSYTDKLVKDWKRIMNMIDKPLPESFQRFELEKSDKIALEIHELNTLNNYHDVSTKEFHVKNMFLLQCETGLRIGDFLKLSEKNIVKTPTGDFLVFKKTQKTGSDYIIPISLRFKAILKQYGSLNNLPSVSDDHINQYIKPLAERAGIEDSARITTHTARRTFITIKREQGISAREISKMVGVSENTIIKTYDRGEGETIAEKLQHHKAFAY